MKLLKRVAAFSLLCAMTVPTVIACGGGGDDKGNKDTVKTISSTLLDGKVANLMSANAIGIEDKNQSVSPMKKSSGGLKTITASADGETAKQAKNELVKETEDGLTDVRFHDGNKGGYRQWNKKFDKHHHGGDECPKNDCDEISDEIEIVIKRPKGSKKLPENLINAYYNDMQSNNIIKRIIAVGTNKVGGPMDVDTDLIKMKHYISVNTVSLTNEVESEDFFDKAQEFINETRGNR